MPKFKKVIRKGDGGTTPEQVPAWLRSIFQPGIAGIGAYNNAIQGLKDSWNKSGNLKTDYNPDYQAPAQLPQGEVAGPPVSAGLPATGSLPAPAKVIGDRNAPRVRNAPMPAKRVAVPNYLDRDMGAVSSMLKSQPELMKTAALGLPSLPAGESGGEPDELASMSAASGKSSVAQAIPKTKAGMKKFMQDYGKFIALGAMAGAGGKGGQIAAPIMAALPGLIEMMKKRGKKAETKAHGGSMAKKSSGGDTPKKSEGGAIRKFSGGITKRMMPKLLEKLESMGDNSRAEMIRQYMPNLPQKKGSLKSTIPDIKVIGGDSEENQYSKGGAIRKFKGGSMNTKDSMLTPKYKKGGNMPKGKAMGEMPQHKKMAMGKPTPQSTGQKFAKGGAAKYAGGGMCKGYGISKKIRPTGPMN